MYDIVKQGEGESEGFFFLFQFILVKDEGRGEKKYFPFRVSIIESRTDMNLHTSGLLRPGLT